MQFRVWLQLAEAFGPVNRYFCSLAHGYEVTKLDTLLEYYIRSGGADDFALRFKEATGPDNRWYCCQHHGVDVGDDLLKLWVYYMQHRQRREWEKDLPQQNDFAAPELAIAC